VASEGFEMLPWTFLNNPRIITDSIYLARGRNKSEIRLVIMVIAVMPCSSPLQEERQYLWPWMDPAPLMCIFGSERSDICPVEITQA
jgi:hypothetical protein